MTSKGPNAVFPQPVRQTVVVFSRHARGLQSGLRLHGVPDQVLLWVDGQSKASEILIKGKTGDIIEQERRVVGRGRTEVSS